MPLIEPNPRNPDPRILPILLRYSRGEISASNAAYEIQEMGIPLFDDPSASEVMIWAKEARFGTPSPSREEAIAEAEALIRRLKRKDEGPAA